MSCPAIFPLEPNDNCNCKYTDKKRSSTMVLGKTKHNTTFNSNQSRFSFGRNTRGRWNFSLTNTKLHPINSMCIVNQPDIDEYNNEISQNNSSYNNLKSYIKELKDNSTPVDGIYDISYAQISQISDVSNAILNAYGKTFYRYDGVQHYDANNHIEEKTFDIKLTDTQPLYILDLDIGHKDTITGHSGNNKVANVNILENSNTNNGILIYLMVNSVDNSLNIINNTDVPCNIWIFKHIGDNDFIHITRPYYSVEFNFVNEAVNDPHEAKAGEDIASTTGPFYLLGGEVVNFLTTGADDTIYWSPSEWPENLFAGLNKVPRDSSNPPSMITCDDDFLAMVKEPLQYMNLTAFFNILKEGDGNTGNWPDRYQYDGQHILNSDTTFKIILTNERPLYILNLCLGEVKSHNGIIIKVDSDSTITSTHALDYGGVLIYLKDINPETRGHERHRFPMIKLQNEKEFSINFFIFNNTSKTKFGWWGDSSYGTISSNCNVISPTQLTDYMNPLGAYAQRWIPQDDDYYDETDPDFDSGGIKQFWSKHPIITIPAQPPHEPSRDHDNGDIGEVLSNLPQNPTPPSFPWCAYQYNKSKNIFSNTSHSMSKKQRLASLMKRGGGKRYRR